MHPSSHHYLYKEMQTELQRYKSLRRRPPVFNPGGIELYSLSLYFANDISCRKQRKPKKVITKENKIQQKKKHSFDFYFRI